MLLSSIISCGAFFYVANYALYRYYFTKPLKSLTFPQVVYKYLKRGPLQKLKQKFYLQSYLVEMKFGLNHKPISGKYLVNETNLESQFSTLFINSQNEFQHLTPMNFQLIKDFEQGITLLAQQNFRSNYLLLNFQHQIDEMHNTYKIRVDQKQFKYLQETLRIEQLRDYYVYIILKQNNKIKICQNFGNKTQDIDFVDQLIQFTIKNEKQVQYIDLNENWFAQNSKDCVQIIKIDDQYNFININKVGDFEIKNDTLYKKLIENLNRKTILFI